MDALTPETLAELEQLRADATPGPWQATSRGIEGQPYADILTGGPVECMSYCYGGTSTIEGDNLPADAALIAAAVNHLPALITAARERDHLAAIIHEAALETYLPEGAEIVVSTAVRLKGEAVSARAERDAVLAEVAALRARMTALADEWEAAGFEIEAAQVRAALDVDTAALDAAPADRDDDEAEGGGVE